MAKNLIDESKAWLPQFYKDGEFIEEPKVKFNGRVLESNIVNFVSDFFKFLLDSKFLNNCTIIWLNSNLSSVQKTFEFYNSQCDEVDMINIKTAQVKINYDKVKLRKYYDDNMLFNVMAYPDKHLDNAIQVLDKLSREYFNDKQYKEALSIKLPKNIIKKEISDNDFSSLLKYLDLYSKKRIEKIEQLEDDNFTSNMIGYYNYLISNKRLSKVDRDRLEQIKFILNI